MLRTLAQPRWIGFGLFAVLMAALFVRLGFWQFHKWEDRTASNAATRSAEAADPVPASALLAPHRAVPAAREYRPVRAHGRYDTSHQVVVRNRPHNGQPGYEVVTPLVTDSGAALLVDRGWVPAGATAATYPDVPAPPAGEVMATGRVRQSQDREGGREDRAPKGQVIRIDVPRLARTLPYPVLGGYVELTSQTPTAHPTPARLSAPDLGMGPYLPYAVQWWLFAGIAVVGWFVLMRREAQEEATTRRDDGSEPPRARQPAGVPSRR